MAGNIYRGSPAFGIENDEEFSFSSWIESSQLEDGHENNVRYSTGENISSDFLPLSLSDSVSEEFDVGQNTADLEIPRTPFPSLYRAYISTENPPSISNSSPISSEFQSSSNTTCSGETQFSSIMGKNFDLSKIKQGDNKFDSPRLEEFVGGGGGYGIFKTPARQAIPPGSPASLEIRPRPLREIQEQQGMRTVVCTGNQLWAGLDSGVRVWKIDDACTSTDHSPRLRGDEETAPFCESISTSPTMCLFPDTANRLVWSGHRDGKVRAWTVNVSIDKDGFEAALTWQAHRAPVLSMVVTSYGELWTGSENGVLRAWPWEATEKALSLAAKESHVAVLSMERSYIDLRRHGVPVGTCGLLDSDIRYLLCDHSTGRVWSGGFFSLALWDAQTRDILKVFETNGRADSCSIDISAVRDIPSEDELKLKFAKVSRKEKTQGTLNFLQRSKNVFIEAVRRATVGSQVEDGTERIEALTTSADQLIWTGYSNGLLVQWDFQGKRMKEFHYASAAVQCLCVSGTRIWIGYADGRVQIMEQDGKLLGGWFAHSSAVMDMAVGGNYVLTLAADGGIRGWTMMSPSPLDAILRLALIQKEPSYTKQQHLKILAGTWNVSQERALCDSLISWLASPASEANIVVIGLQEIEMGAGFLAMAAAKETVGIEGSANGQWWLDAIGKILDEGMTFERVGSRQLAGLLIGVWVRKDLCPYIGEVDVGAVACGFGRTIGNKGAVALKMRVFGQILCVINCHFAAHVDAIARRNEDFEYVYRNLTFSPMTAGVNTVAAGVSSAVQKFKILNVRRGPDLEAEKDILAAGVASEVLPELAEADMLIWFGDFNYRLDDISYDEARNYIARKHLDTLLRKDQLRGEMKAGHVFQGMREANIKFPPTYKFDRGQIGLQGYDSSEKKRVPAWCDRVIFRDNRNGTSTQCKLTCPVVASVTWYDACMDVKDSDHKPVRCMFSVDIACVDERIRRREFGDLLCFNKEIKALLEEYNRIPDTVVSTNNIVLQDSNSSVLRITNTCKKNKAIFEVLCGSEAFVNSAQRYGISIRSSSVRGCFGFPRWLQVRPASGVIGPGEIVEISVYHEDFYIEEEYVDGTPQNWWCEDERDKVVILLISVRGNGSREIKQHQIRLSHCYTSRVQSPYKDENKKIQTNTLQRANFQLSNCSSNPAPDLHFDNVMNRDTNQDI